MKHELRQMIRQGSGAIVNNASVGALTGNPGIGSYIASKHGVVGRHEPLPSNTSSKASA